MHVIRLQTVDSTNSWIAGNEDELPSPVMVSCHTQLAGRGQRGNSWESEPGKNITASVLFHLKDFPAAKQFVISEAIALAMVDFLDFHGIDAKVKWPNDIYVGDKKIAGILVEHSVMGRNITRTIAGIGLNVNQEVFVSDAPNPVSMKILTGENYNPEELELIFSDSIEKYLDKLESPAPIHQEFMNRLWRNDGNTHLFFDKKENELIKARIAGVGPDGILSLEKEDGEIREFAFKEVEFLLVNS